MEQTVILMGLNCIMIAEEQYQANHSSHVGLTDQEL